MPVLSDEMAILVARKRTELFGSYRAAAAATGISVGTWQRVEKGESFEQSTLFRIGNNFGWDHSQIIKLMAGFDPEAGDREQERAAAREVREMVQANEEERLSAVERRLDRIERLLRDRLGSAGA